MFFNYEYQGNVPLLIIFFFFSQHLLDNELISVLFFFLSNRKQAGQGLRAKRNWERVTSSHKKLRPKQRRRKGLVKGRKETFLLLLTLRTTNHLKFPEECAPSLGKR